MSVYITCHRMMLPSDQFSPWIQSSPALLFASTFLFPLPCPLQGKQGEWAMKSLSPAKMAVVLEAVAWDCHPGNSHLVALKTQWCGNYGNEMWSFYNTERIVCDKPYLTIIHNTLCLPNYTYLLLFFRTTRLLFTCLLAWNCVVNWQRIAHPFVKTAWQKSHPIWLHELMASTPKSERTLWRLLCVTQPIIKQIYVFKICCGSPL